MVSLEAPKRNWSGGGTHERSQTGTEPPDKNECWPDN